MKMNEYRSKTNASGKPVAKKKKNNNTRPRRRGKLNVGGHSLITNNLRGGKDFPFVFLPERGKDLKNLTYDLNVYPNLNLRRVLNKHGVSRSGGLVCTREPQLTYKKQNKNKNILVK